MGSTGSTQQIATKAVAVENMNEAQLDKEISRAERQLASAQSAMQKYGTATQYQRAMQEAFPLGAGGDGWTKSRIAERNRDIETTVKNAKKFTEAYDRAQTMQRRLEILQNAKKTVAGTGKTSKEIADERARQAIAETPKTLKWKTTQKAQFTGSSYRPQIMQAGEMRIEGGSGIYRVYKGEKLLGTVSKLSMAKALAERRK